jgi:hypothetical protein
MGYTVGCTDALCIAEPDVTMECMPRNGDKCGVRLGAVDFSGTLDVDVFSFGQDRANISFGCVTGTNLDQPGSAEARCRRCLRFAVLFVPCRESADG